MKEKGNCREARPAHDETYFSCQVVMIPMYREDGQTYINVTVLKIHRWIWKKKVTKKEAFNQNAKAKKWTYLVINSVESTVDEVDSRIT